MRTNAASLTLSCLLAASLPAQLVDGEPANRPPATHDGVIGGGGKAVPSDLFAGIVPIGARHSMGNSDNAIPFSWTPTKYQQVFRADELPTTLLMNWLGVRNGNRTDPGATVEVEMTLGYTTYDQTSLTNTYANNFNSGTPTVVMARQKVLIPNMPATNANPYFFFHEFKFDRPFIWTNQAGRNLLWQAIVFGNDKGNANYLQYLNARSASTSTRLYGADTATSGTLGVGYGLVVNFTTISQVGRKFGSVDRYGAGCPGTAPSPGKDCVTLNPNASSILTTTTLVTGRIFVLEATAPTDIWVAAVEFFLQANSQQTTNTYLFLADASGQRPDTTAAAQSTVQVNTTAGWCKTTFTTPVAVQGGRKFYVGFTSFATVYPALSSGSTGIHWWNHPTWSGPWPSLAWGYKVECQPRSGAVPSITFDGQPTTGMPHKVDLGYAAPNTAAILWLSGQQLNIDLTAAGAPGCRLLVGLDVPLPVATSASGAASMSFPVPSDKALIGLRLKEQWTVIDKPANKLGVVFTAALDLTFGGL